MMMTTVELMVCNGMDSRIPVCFRHLFTVKIGGLQGPPPPPSITASPSAVKPPSPANNDDNHEYNNSSGNTPTPSSSMPLASPFHAMVDHPSPLVPTSYHPFWNDFCSQVDWIFQKRRLLESIAIVSLCLGLFGVLWYTASFVVLLCGSIILFVVNDLVVRRLKTLVDHDMNELCASSQQKLQEYGITNKHMTIQYRAHSSKRLAVSFSSFDHSRETTSLNNNDGSVPRAYNYDESPTRILQHNMEVVYLFRRTGRRRRPESKMNPTAYDYRYPERKFSALGDGGGRGGGSNLIMSYEEWDQFAKQIESMQSWNRTLLFVVILPSFVVAQLVLFTNSNAHETAFELFGEAVNVLLLIPATSAVFAMLIMRWHFDFRLRRLCGEYSERYDPYLSFHYKRSSDFVQTVEHSEGGTYQASDGRYVEVFGAVRPYKVQQTNFQSSHDRNKQLEETKRVLLLISSQLSIMNINQMPSMGCLDWTNGGANRRLGVKTSSIERTSHLTRSKSTQTTSLVFGWAGAVLQGCCLKLWEGVANNCLVFDQLALSDIGSVLQ